MSERDLPEPGTFKTFVPFLQGVFSQWHVTPFVVGAMTFNTAEQWMMANKAVLFGDHDRATAIMAAESRRTEEAWPAGERI